MQRSLHAAALAGLAALAVAMGIGRFAFTPILPMMLGDAGLTVAQGGWLASANYLGYLAGGLSAVALRREARWAIRAGLLAVSVSTIAMGLATGLVAWILWRALAGAASAWVLVFAASWGLEQFAARGAAARRPVLGATLFAGVGVGIVIAGATCAALLIAQMSSRAAWIALGVVSIACTALLWNRFDDHVAHGEDKPAPAPARFDPAWLAMVACYGAFGFGYIVPATFLSAMAREAAAGSASYAWAWPAFGAAAAASTFLAAALRRRLSDRALWSLGQGVMAAGVVMPLAANGTAGIVASALLVGGTFMVVTMAGMQEARRVAGASGRTLIAAMTSSFALGQVAGPLLVSYLAARGEGYATALAAAGAALAVSALAIPFVSTPERKP
ncbi:MAG: YbfB/YjiJ family MFS transporter [Usitatibacter sp.]